jgi:hypothetical protein
LFFSDLDNEVHLHESRKNQTYQNIRSLKSIKHGLDFNSVCDIGGDIKELRVRIAFSEFRCCLL